jgi:hypothetical protein
MTSNDKQDPQLSPLYSLILDVEPKIQGVVYNYTSAEDFLKIDSIAEMQLVYWSEIVQRMHVCAATSIKRIKKWYDAANSAYNADNYYGVCASLRGLVEACADTFYTAVRIIDPVCTNFATIEKALKGDATKVLLSKPIEDELIHYVFARKIAKSEKGILPNSHEANHVRTYLDSIAHQGVLDLYDELCQVSHPSTISLNPFLLSTEEHTLILHKEKIDRDLNDNLLKRHKAAILTASKMSVLPSMCILKLINEFNAPITEALRTDEQPLQAAIQSDLWKDMEAKIQKSRDGQQGAEEGPGGSSRSAN